MNLFFLKTHFSFLYYLSLILFFIFSSQHSEATTTNQANPNSIYVEPIPPPEGGVYEVPHPNASKGLLKIDKNKVYHYEVPLKAKSQSMHLKFTSITAPIITNDSGTTFDNMYAKSNLSGITYEYEWIPLRRFGSLGLQFGLGLSSVQGAGVLAGTGISAKESFTLFIVPVGLSVVYRFEYFPHQWVVPFLSGGGIYYGLAEARDDSRKPNTAGSSAVGGGGGLLLSITRLDPEGGFIFSKEYDISDLWLIIEAKAFKSFKKDIDFTNNYLGVGLSVDY